MSKKENKILFSIITYHPNPHQLNKLLAVLKPYQVILIDNTKNNLGYAGGANKAIKKALEQKVDWVVILNQDLIVTTSFLQKFVSVLKTSKPGIVGPFAGTLDKKRWTTILSPVILGSEATPESDSGQAPTAVGIPIHIGARMTNNMTKYISGSFIAIHKKVVDKIGDFYQPYFMYYEDADYCIRAQKAGFPIMPVKIPGISHRDATSLGQNSFLHEYYLARNHLLFVKRNAPLSVKLHALFRFPKTIYEHLKYKNYGALKGIFDFVLGKFGHLYLSSSRKRGSI